jgi:hypothetical protein
VRLTAEKIVAWNEPSAPAGVTTEKVYLGPDPFGLGGFQVAVATIVTPPNRQVLRDLFTARKGRTQIQLVVAVVHDGTVHIFGPDPQAQPVEFPVEQAERQLQSVLAEPDVLAATERFAGFRKASDSTGVPGFTNSGLFATHHIMTNVTTSADWETLGRQALPLLGMRRKHLIQALGFNAQPGPNGTLLLSIDEHPPRAVAVLLDDSEQFDAKTQRFQLSPVAFGLAVATRQEVPWLIVLRKDQIRLYPGRDGVGVGSKGQAETFFEVDLSVIEQRYAALLPLIFSANALTAGGTTDELLRDSARYATELGARLRERIYDEIVPPVAVEVSQRLAKYAGLKLDTNGLSTAYRVTLRILFRLLFQAYAEDRGLLPSGRNAGFDANSLKTNARRLLDSDTDEFGDASTIWLDLVQVWNAIDKGNPQWQIPSYNGGLFSTDPERSPEGALIKKIELPDSVLGPALKSLLIDMNDEGVLGPVDFRSLSVREFGTIYEGLLESSLSMAEQDLTVDNNGTWMPSSDGDVVHAPSGTAYFHTASGERKATGSYFTPKVIVDHLIERSIVPVLTVHLEKVSGHLAKGDVAAASRDFFDFRVADLAMGSGHFLVAAVDKIEALMRTFLTEHTVPGVTEELLRLAGVAKEALGSDDVAKSEVDEVGLLRRQVARRCIYGLDLNPMAVELARLALWIHTFVPGLPMSNLDHGLVNANSLTGIGTIDEALDALQPGREPGEIGLFDDILTDQLASAKTLLVDVANASEANKAEVEEGARLLAHAREAADTARRIFDAAVAARISRIEPGLILDDEARQRMLQQPEVAEVADDLHPAHLPYLFPEVFLRPQPGFDVVIGNPPWEELVYEEIKFWTLRFPGLKGHPVRRQQELIAEYRASRPDLVVQMESERDASNAMRAVLSEGPFPGLETGHADLYKAFGWRFLQFTRRGGRFAVVMPRTAMSALGSAEWRNAVLDQGTFADVTSLVNTGRWAFERVDGRYTVALVVAGIGSDGDVDVRGPYSDAKTFVEQSQTGAVVVRKDQLQKWSSSASFPLLPSPESFELFLKLREAPSIGQPRSDFEFCPVQGDFNQTSDASLWSVGDSSKAIPVLKGASFDIWSPDAGLPHGSAAARTIHDRALTKLRRQVRTSSSAFHRMDVEKLKREGRLPYQQPRIAFRDVARATDTRTTVASLVPPAVLINSAPFLVRRSGSAAAEAYVLGVMCSIPFDWYSRRYVELHMNFHIFNWLPVPAFDLTAAGTRQIVEIAGRLAAIDDRYSAWASDVEVPIGSVKTKAEKDDLIEELDALVSLLYGLTEDQVDHMFATFHQGWDYRPRLESVLKHYRVWKGKT